MTRIIKEHVSYNYYISMEIEWVYDSWQYVVVACPHLSDGFCGYPVRKMTYTLSDRKNALRTYNRYVKKYL